MKFLERVCLLVKGNFYILIFVTILIYYLVFSESDSDDDEEVSLSSMIKQS